MFLGMDLLGLDFFGLWKIYVMIGFVVWYVGIEIVLEIYVYRFFRKGNNLFKKLRYVELYLYKF